MKKTRTLLDDVSVNIKQTRAGYQSWFEKLPAEAQEECALVREAFRRGEIGPRTVIARALIAAAKERGWQIAQEKQVSSWLAKKDD